MRLCNFISFILQIYYIVGFRRSSSNSAEMLIPVQTSTSGKYYHGCLYIQEACDTMHCPLNNSQEICSVGDMHVYSLITFSSLTPALYY